jgi:hypothetical protein
MTLVLLLLTWTATAHHFKGLPHFSYFENYPQVPQDEFLAQAGDFEFSLVLYDFQGIDKSDVEQPDNARFFLVAYNLRENRAYQGQMQAEIVDGTTILHSELVVADSESIYSFQRNLGPEGDYAVRLRLLDADDLSVEMPFLLSSQRVAWSRWIGSCLVLLIVVVAVGSRRARIAMDRKQNAAQRRAQEVSSAESSAVGKGGEPAT